MKDGAKGDDARLGMGDGDPVDVCRALTDDHARLAASLRRLVDFVEANDTPPARDEWDAFEPGVLRHLDAEEMLLIPTFERVDAAEAKAIRDEHAAIRRFLGDIGLAFDLHLVRREPIASLEELLARHVIRETRSMYAWAGRDENRALARSVLRRLGRPVPPSPEDAMIGTLLGLVRACRDGQRGYAHAAEDTTDEGYRLVFLRYAAERATFAEALARILRRYGVDIDSTGSVLGALHREWLDASAKLTGGHATAILRECVRGDLAAQTLYERAQRAGLPPDVQELVQSQHEALGRAHVEIESLLELEKRQAT